MQNLESMAVREEYKRPKWTAKTYKSVVKSEDAAGDVGFFLPYRSLDFLDDSGEEKFSFIFDLVTFVLIIS